MVTHLEDNVRQRTCRPHTSVNLLEPKLDFPLILISRVQPCKNSWGSASACLLRLLVRTIMCDDMRFHDSGCHRSEEHLKRQSLKAHLHLLLHLGAATRTLGLTDGGK